MNSHRLCLLIMVLGLLTAGTIVADAPPLLNYQGRLTNALGEPVADGTYSVTFTIYDAPVGGTVEWSETRDITTVDGLFFIVLGEVTPIDRLDLVDTATYLGLQIGTSPEGTPRTRLASVPFAVSASNVQGRINGVNRAVLACGSNTAALHLSGPDGLYQASLRQIDSRGGELYLSRQDGTTDRAISLSTYRSDIGSHAHLSLRNAGGIEKVLLDADGIGDGAALLPIASVSSDEMYNEPGITSNFNTNTVVLTPTMTDIVTVGITAPSAGYLLVIAKGTAFISGTLDTNYGYVQIDDTQGGNADNPYRTVFGACALPNYYTWLFPFTVTRVFPATPGTYKSFRLEGRHSGTQGAGADIDVRNAQIQVLFFPSAYGSNATLVAAEEAARFENAVPIVVDGETKYEVDLRELELKAARERAKAEKAEAEAARAEAALERARREEAEKQSQAGSAGNH